MKKEYTSPKIETVKIKPEDSAAAFAAGQYNSQVITKANSSAINIIIY